jgi:hypothetical protein
MNIQDAQNQLLGAYVARDNLDAQRRQVEDNIRDLRNFIAGAQSVPAPEPSEGHGPEPSAQE